MKKFWIIFGSIIGVLILLLYLAFLFVLPNVVKLDEYKPIVQKLVKEQIPLNINFKNAKITTTPLLSIGVKADDIRVNFEDNTSLFSADSAKFRVALPSLLALTVKVSTAEINNPKVNLAIVDGKQFKILMLVEELLQKQEENITNKNTAEETNFDPSIIRIKVPNFKLNNYSIKIIDEKSKHDLKLQGENLKLGYFNGKKIKIKTNAEFFSDNDKNITANIDINSFLPPVTKLDEEDDKPERIELPFINPVLTYREYNLKSDLNTKLKIREKNGLIKLYGFLNIDNTTLNLSDYTLPKCYFHGKFNGTKADIDTTLSVAKNKSIVLKGLFDYGKNTKIDMAINTDKIYFQDLITLSKAYLDSLHIKNHLDLISGAGYLEANANIKTNLKKLESNGKIIVRDGGIINKSINLGISKTNLSMFFDNNNLAIDNSYTYINNSILKFDGKIDEKSNTDIKIFADRIPISGLYKAFAPNDLKKSYLLNKGDVTLNTEIKGQLKTAFLNAKINLKNFLIQDVKNTLKISNDDLTILFNADAKEKTQKITIENKGLSVLFPQLNSSIKDNSLKITLDGTTITLLPTDILLNNTSKITFDGLIDTAKNKSIFKINGNGEIFANDLKKFAGDQASPFIDAKGKLPITLTVDGNNKRQNFLLRVLGSQNNYITPVNFAQTLGKNTVLQAQIDFKENRLKIKNTGLFTSTIITDEKGNQSEKLNEIIGVNGTIANLNTTPFINIIRVTIPKELSGNICGFKNAGFKLNGRLFVFGNSLSPRIRGHLNLHSLYVKDLLTTLDALILDFKGKTLNINAKNLVLNGSEISSQLNLSLEPSSIIQISNLNINSRNIDLDRLMMLATTASRLVPPSKTPATPPTNIPISVKNSSFNCRHIKTGNINLYNTNTDIAINNNNLYLNNMRTRAFGGNMNGRISMNLLNNLLRINVYGHNINTDKMLSDAANMKDTLSGKLDFRTNLTIDGGATNYVQQMKSLGGNINFTIQNGQLGPFGKLENMILAENIRNSQFFQTAIGGIISGLTTIDTTHFKELKGTLSFNNGITTLKPITSEGNVLTLHISGDFDLLKNTADLKVRGRLASMLSNVLGPIANINPINLVKVTPGLNVASAKMFSLFTQPVTEDEMKQIPAFKTKTDNLNATNFQIIVNGDVNKPLTLVKSFKWLALQSQIDSASEFVSTLPEPETLTSTVEEIEAAQAEQAKTSTKIKNVFFKKDQKLREEQMNETKKILEQMKEQENNQQVEDL